MKEIKLTIPNGNELLFDNNADVAEWLQRWYRKFVSISDIEKQINNNIDCIIIVFGDTYKYQLVEKQIDTWSFDGTWICPYCGHGYKYDHTEDVPSDIEFDDYEWQCPKCGETYLVSQSVSFTHHTKKITCTK